MVRYPELASALKGWWQQQDRFKNLRELALACGMSHNSLKHYFYGAMWPNTDSLQRLLMVIPSSAFPERGALSSQATQGRNQARTPSIHVSPPRLLSKRFKRHLEFALHTSVKGSRYASASMGTVFLLAEELCRQGVPIDDRFSLHLADAVQQSMDTLERALRPFVETPGALKVLRGRLRGPDAGYLSGLLSALMDDRRIANWRAMTTYKYGGRRR